jgi:nicotinamidase-related amidase
VPNHWLQRSQVSGLVIAGITTNHCCETTARMAEVVSTRELLDR